MSDVLSRAFPIGLALLSALSFAVAAVLVRGGVKQASPSTALWLTLSVNVVFLWGWSLLVYGWQFEHWWEWRYFFISGVFAPLLGRLFQFHGMVKLGVNITTPLTLTHPVISVVLAIFFLGESLAPLGLFGALLVAVGCVMVGSQGGQRATRSLDTVSRIYLLLPLISALCYGVSMVFRKVGIDIGTDPVTAAAVTSTSAWFFATLYLLATGEFRGAIRCSRRDFGFFLLYGVFSGFGPMLVYAALQYEDLVIIAPLASTTPLFTLLISYLFLRKDEIFTPLVLIGTVTTVAGVILITAYGLA